MKPILFNTDMVRAIQHGEKTVTRRVVKFKTGYDQRTGYHREGLLLYGHNDEPAAKCPYQEGDILYVRETWKVQSARRFDADVRIMFKAGGDMTTIQFPNGDSDSTDRSEYDAFTKKWMPGDGWHPSIHMPKEAARIFLRVTDVRVERLQEPFFEQGSTIFALQEEGVDIGDQCRQCIENYGGPCCNDLDPDLEFDEDTGEDTEGGSECGMLDEVRYAFSRLWDSTIPKHPNKFKRYPYYWEDNPWVWVIHFEQISKEESTNNV